MYCLCILCGFGCFFTAKNTRSWRKEHKDLYATHVKFIHLDRYLNNYWGNAPPCISQLWIRLFATTPPQNLRTTVTLSLAKCFSGVSVSIRQPLNNKSPQKIFPKIW